MGEYAMCNCFDLKGKKFHTQNETVSLEHEKDQQRKN